MPKSLRPRGGRKPSTTRAVGRALPRTVLEDLRGTTREADREPAISRTARAIELLDRGDPSAALVEAEKAKRYAPRSASVREVLGLAYYGVGRWQEAVTELKTYRRITGRPDQNHLIADAMRALGRPEEAVPLAEEALASTVPNDVKAEAVVVAAAALADQGSYTEALAFLKRARTREDFAEPYTLRLWYVRGDILQRAGRPVEAAAEFRKILRHDAGAFDAAERLAQVT